MLPPSTLSFSLITPFLSHQKVRSFVQPLGWWLVHHEPHSAGQTGSSTCPPLRPVLREQRDAKQGGPQGFWMVTCSPGQSQVIMRCLWNSPVSWKQLDVCIWSSGERPGRGWRATLSYGVLERKIGLCSRSTAYLFPTPVVSIPKSPPPILPQ